MKIRKYTDWRGWLAGMRSKAFQAGAESLVTNLGAMIGSNGIASMIPSLHDYTLSWKTALVTTFSQFVIRSIWAAAKYVADKPDPDVITEEVDTSSISKTGTPDPKP